MGRLGSRDLDPEERRILLEGVVSPSWQARFGTDAFTADHATWQRERADERIRRARLPLKAQPERIALVALVPAWRAGLTTVVAIPCRGTFTRVIGQHSLLVTSETRADPGRYQAALASFPGNHG